MTHDASVAYSYDGAGRMIAAGNGSTPAAYTYFGALRIKKVVGSTTTITIYSGSKPIAEYASGAALTNPLNEYVYSGSSLLATIAGTAVTYHHPDHLSNRAETDSSGTVTRTYGHFPFGETWYETGTPDKWKFTGYERDSSESGLDYGMNRMYSSGYGRFQTADLMAGSPSDPQSLNRFAYTGSDPLNFIDPSGLQQHPIAYVPPDPCQGFVGCAQFGNDIFDAFGGAPGTYVNLDQFGNITWGFDPGLATNATPGRMNLRVAGG
ncbi:MAG: RHS repeat-associated core domain-containing protein, partial [Candidatus Angelobacter sp.]